MHKNIYLYFVFVFFSNFSIMGTFLSLYFNSIGISLSNIATLFMIYQLSKFIFEVPTGFLADKYGNRVSGIVGAIFILVANIIILFSGCSFAYMLTYMIIKGIGYTFISGSVEALFINTADNGKLGKYNAIERLIFYSVTAFSSVIGGIIAGDFGYRICFIIDTAMVIMMIITVLFMSEKNISNKKSNEVQKGYRVSKILAVILIIDFATAFSFVAVEDYYSYYLGSGFGMASNTIGIVVAFQLLLGALIGAIVHKMNFMRLNVNYIFIGAILSIILIIPIYMKSVNLIVIPICYTLSNTVFAIYAPIKYELFQKNVANEHRAFFISMQSIVISFGSILFSALNSVLGRFFEYAVVMIIAFAISLVLYMASWIYTRSCIDLGL